MKFSDIIGQQHIKEHFQSSIMNGTLSHAYIINGEKSTGKTMLAKAFAMAIMCDMEGSEPCLECDSCKKIINKCNPDVITLVRDTKKKTDIIGIDEIRSQIIAGMYDRPYYGERKVYIIEDADKMNVQAQNALLKTLEEPPGYAVLILTTTNASRLLPTILSRCIVLNMRPVTDKVIRSYLREQDRFLDDTIDVIVAMSSGNIGKAKLLSEDKDFITFQNDVLDILKSIPNSDYRRVLDGVEKLSLYTGNLKQKKKKSETKDVKIYSTEEVFDIFVLWYRDVLLFKATEDTNNLIFKKEATEIAKQSMYFKYDSLNIVIQMIEDAKSKIKSNLKFSSVMEILLINIQEISKK